MFCPHCNKEIDPKLIAQEFARKGGSVISKKKTVAVKLNGKKGGRPTIQDKWNAQADKWNQWDNLSDEEKKEIRKANKKGEK